MGKNNFWSKLKSFGNNVVEWFRNLINANDEVYKKYAPLAINIVNGVKEFNDSPEADIIAVITTKLLGRYGAVATPIIVKVRAWMTAHLGEILDGMRLGEAVANATTIEAKSLAAQNYIKAMGIKEATYKWTELASKIADALSDGRFTTSEIAAIIICAYSTYRNESNTLE